MTIEYKNLQCKFSYEKDCIIKGLANVFNIIDYHGDIVLPGAMTKSLEKSYKLGYLPAMLLEHNIALYAGVWYDVKEEQNYLFVQGRVLSDTDGGTQAIAQLLSGCLNGLSIGYAVISSYKDIDTGVRYITEIDLYEVSMVQNPANKYAVITDVTKVE